VRGGTWCKRCAARATGALRRLSIEAMRELARQRGGECLSDEYVDSWVKLRWRCGQCGNAWDAAPANVRKGTWCPKCAVREGWNLRRSRYGESGGNAKRPPKYTIADMRALAAARGGRCLSSAYAGAHERLKWSCGECGHEWLAAPSDVRKGTWCRLCSTRRRWARQRNVASGPKRP
jgi:rubrerythrin